MKKRVSYTCNFCRRLRIFLLSLLKLKLIYICVASNLILIKKLSPLILALKPRSVIRSHSGGGGGEGV